MNTGKIDFINNEGIVEFSIDESDISYMGTIYTSKDKGINIMITENKGKTKIYDVNDFKNFKEIMKFSTTDKFYPYGFIDIIEDKKYYENEETEEDKPYEKSTDDGDYLVNTNTNDYATYETDQNANYTYYTNSNMVIQVVHNTNEISLDELSESTENVSEQYYLIDKNKGERKKLDCKKLLYLYNYEIDDNVIMLFNKKYIPYIDNGKNGYFDENGQKVELNNDFVFLDAGDNIAIVQKVNESDRNVTSDDEENYEDDNEINQIVVVNKDLKVISEVYNEAMYIDGLYILQKEDESGNIVYSVWSKKDGKKIDETDYDIEELDGKLLILKKKDNTLTMYNKNGKIETDQYTDGDLHYMGNENNGNVENEVYLLSERYYLLAQEQIN